MQKQVTLCWGLGWSTSVPHINRDPHIKAGRSSTAICHLIPLWRRWCIPVYPINWMRSRFAYSARSTLAPFLGVVKINISSSSHVSASSSSLSLSLWQEASRFKKSSCALFTGKKPPTRVRRLRHRRESVASKDKLDKIASHQPWCAPGTSGSSDGLG